MVSTDNAMDIALEVDAEAVSQLRREGLAVGKMTSTTNDAFRMVNVYHAFDGRVVTVPVYMVDPSEGDSLLKRVFTKDDRDIDPKFLGKRVWYLKPQESDRLVGTILCPFSVFNDDETKAKMVAEGFNSNCRNKTKFATKYDVENHVRLRHPKRHAARMKFDLEKNADRQAETAATTNEALMVLVQELLAKQGAGTKPAPKEKVTE